MWGRLVSLHGCSISLSILEASEVLQSDSVAAASSVWPSSIWRPPQVLQVTEFDQEKKKKKKIKISKVSSNLFDATDWCNVRIDFSFFGLFKNLFSLRSPMDLLTYSMWYNLCQSGKGVRQRVINSSRKAIIHEQWVCLIFSLGQRSGLTLSVFQCRPCRHFHAFQEPPHAIRGCRSQSHRVYFHCWRHPLSRHITLLI